MGRPTTTLDDMTFLGVGTNWRHCIDVSEHHHVDFDVVAQHHTDGVIVRAGRGTRQDARWIENVRAARSAGLTVGSYWHVRPSHADPHHQAELWMAAVRGADRWAFDRGHWADVTAADGFDRHELGRYVAAFVRRVDALLGRPAGVFTSDAFWDDHVSFDDPTRPRWLCQVSLVGGRVVAGNVSGIRTRAADRGGPGWHLAEAVESTEDDATNQSDLRLHPRLADETIDDWKARWIRTDDVVGLQLSLNELGATLLVDGVFGPATDAAVKTRASLLRRDRAVTDPTVGRQVPILTTARTVSQ